MNLVQDVCQDVVILNEGKIVAKDSVEALMDMFESMTYEIILVENLEKEDKNYLLNLDYEFYFDHNGSKIEIDILEFEEIYEIIEILRNRDIFNKRNKTKDNNFERI